VPWWGGRTLRYQTPPDLDGLEMADWDRVCAVNVRGLFQVSRACVPLLAAAPHPAIVNLASIAGLRPGPQPFPYAASKAAVANLTKTLAGRLGPQGIRVNAVAPGWMAGEWMEDQLGENYDRLMERRARLTPLRRCVTPDEVAQTILSLVTSNPFVTGEIVVIDGGFTATT
jgi:3-oxoacyl-[acyl-carrier protein] reductase